MWKELTKEAAANLSRQQENFVSSIRVEDDSGAGWGDVAEREAPAKVGWGAPDRTSPSAAKTGWGADNTSTVIRGWGSQVKSPAPDWTQTLKDETPRMKAEEKPQDISRKPETNGWSAPKQPSASPKFQKQVETPGTKGVGTFKSATTAQAKTTCSSLKAPEQQPPKQPKTTLAGAEPQTNGSTQKKPGSNLATKPAISPVTPAGAANVSVRSKVNATARTRDLYVPPQAKRAASKAAAAASSTSSVPRTERTPVHTERSNSVSVGATNSTSKDRCSEPIKESPVETTSASPTVAPGKTDSTKTPHENMFIEAESEKARLKELILLLENHPHRRPALLIVDRSRTNPLLLSAFLSLAGLRASPTSSQSTPDSLPIRVICTDELNTSSSPAQLVVNVDMIRTIEELTGRRKFLGRNGIMKTFLVLKNDSVRAANLALMFRDCGLPVPPQLESFIPLADQ